MATKPYVFISYAHRNSDLVFPAIQALQAGNVELWYDNGIEAGSEWPEYVAEKVVNCDKFVLFVSNAYLESQNCKRELNFAISRKKDILSIYLEDVNLSPGMEMQLGTYQAIFRNRFPSNQQFYAALPNESFFNACKNTSQDTQTTMDSQGFTSTYHGAAAPHQTYTPPTNNWSNTSAPAGGGSTSQLPKKSKLVAILLAFFLGGLGAHKFYLGKMLHGILYLFLCWTYIPALLSLVDIIKMLRQSKESFEQTYKCTMD